MKEKYAADRLTGVDTEDVLRMAMVILSRVSLLTDRLEKPIRMPVYSWELGKLVYQDINHPLDALLIIQFVDSALPMFTPEEKTTIHEFYASLIHYLQKTYPPE